MLAKTLSATLCIQVFTLLQGVAIAKILGPAGRGEFAAIILWANFFAAIGGLGGGVALARIAAKNKGDVADLKRMALIVGCVTGGLTALLCNILIGVLLKGGGAHLVGTARLYTLFIPINHVILAMMSVDQGAGNLGEFNLRRVMLYPIYFGLVAALYVSGARDASEYCIALLVSNVLLLVYMIVRDHSALRIRSNSYSAIHILRAGSSFGIADIIVPMTQYLDKALVLWLLGPLNLGIYSVAGSASGIAAGISSAIGIVAFSVSASQHEASDFRRIAKLFRQSLIAWGVVGLFLIILMPFVLPALFGKDFKGAVMPACVLVFGVAFSGQGQIAEQVLRGQGVALAGIWGRLVALCALCGVGVLLARGEFGVTGMAISYSLSQAIYAAFLLAIIFKKYGVKFGEIIPGVSDCRDLMGAVRDKAYSFVKRNGIR